jgi:dihydroneopterin aldolase
VSNNPYTQVSYADVFNQVKAIVEGPPSALLETVAERIAGG